MAIIDKETLIQYIKDDLQAGIVNLEISDDVIERNLDRALALSSDAFNYTTYKTVEVNRTTSSGGYIDLKELDPDGIPTVVAVYPTTGIMNVDAALLGLGSIYINTNLGLSSRLNAYANMIHRVSQLESILGRNARVVGDKLYVDKYFDKVTVEYIPEVIKIENITEGSWIRFLVDYSVALCKRQIAQSRGKYTVASNPATTNAAELLENANTRIAELEEELKRKGVLLASR